jgi:hypothetical protein
LVSSPNLSFLKVKIHFVNKKVFAPPSRPEPRVCKSTHKVYTDCHARLAMTDRKLADGALNARLPRHFADGRNNDRARRWGFRGDFQGGTKGRRNAMRPSPSPLEPPLEVLETFGGAKVSDKRPAKEGS